METWGEVSVTTIVWGKGRRWGVGRRKRKGRDGSRREERGYEREGGTGDDGGGRKTVRERIMRKAGRKGG